MGKPAITPAAQAALVAAGIPAVLLLARHIHGGWGHPPVEDLATNELAVLTGKRLLSSYELPGDGKVWIITEADRSETTILLLDDY
jgi:hypothetical protein